MTKILITVFLGGGFGSILRFAVQEIMRGHTASFTFPWATFGVNVAGSFLIGLFYVLSARFNFSDETRLFLTTGLCGGFTTFSTFSHEGMSMLRQGCYTAFLIYAAASIVAGISAAIAGGWAGTALTGK